MEVGQSVVEGSWNCGDSKVREATNFQFYSRRRSFDRRFPTLNDTNRQSVSLIPYQKPFVDFELIESFGIIPS